MLFDIDIGGYMIENDSVDSGIFAVRLLGYVARLLPGKVHDVVASKFNL